MTFLKKILQSLLHNWTIGIVLTLLFAYLSINYYSYDVDARETHSNPLINVFHRLHQATVNWKLKTRGYRKGSKDVVLLTVDEKALAQEGQWPWPRSRIKDVIVPLMEGGAKVIGFDIVWPEEELNSSVMSLKNLHQDLKSEYSGKNLDTLIDKHIKLSQTDQILGEAIEEYADRLVLGNYFDPPLLSNFRYPEHGYMNLCLEQIYRLGENYEKWQNQDPYLSVIDQSVIGFSDEMPESFAAIIAETFATIDSQSENAEQGNIAKWNYCLNWLNDPKDLEKYRAVWATVQAEDEALLNLSFEEGIEVFKSRYLGMKMEMVGKWVMNIDAIQSKTMHSGFFNAKQDSDGTIRRSFLMVKTGQSFFPSLAFHTFMLAKGLRAQVTLQPDSSGIEMDFKHISSVELMNEDGEVVETIPVNKEGYLTINYAGPQKMFAHLSAAEVLNDRPTVTVSEKVYDAKADQWRDQSITHKKSDYYKDKIFVFGVTAIGLFDLRVTPFQENFPGLETHANVIDNLLRHDFLKAHNSEEFYMIAFVLIMGLLFTYILGHFGALQSLGFVVGVLFAIIFIDWHFFFKEGIVVSIVFPISLIAAIYSALTVFKYFTEERNKKQLKGTFGKYVSPAIVEEILAHPDNIELGGRKQVVTVFFSDVRGFTTISETLSPTQLSDLLNEYLTPMTEIIFEHNGTLDKYIGDAIMAFFGAPIANADHPREACLAALENVKRLLELQKVLEERNLPHIDVGIGLNTGEVSVGNMGSNIVRNYTIMGDAVNLGARLEGITKQYGVRIIISEYTEKEIRGQFLTREVDCVKVKGKKLPVHIFELMSEKGEDPKLEEIARIFGLGYQCYQQKKWEEGIKHFKEVLTLRDDVASKLYIDRCTDYLENPPPADWDGVYTMTTK